MGHFEISNHKVFELAPWPGSPLSWAASATCSTMSGCSKVVNFVFLYEGQSRETTLILLDKMEGVIVFVVLNFSDNSMSVYV